MRAISIIVLLTAFTFIKAQQKPNIIFILADDMGYSDMTWQSSSIQTPNLDRMKSEGMFLERHYTQPQCTPSRVAFLTGNYPYRYGLHEHIVMSSSYTGIPGEIKTIAEKMKEGGYKTAVIGKWHVGGLKQSYLPHNQGFDYSYVCINGAISYWNYTHAGTSDLMRNGNKVYAPSMVNNEESGNTYSTYMWANEAIDLINSHDKKQPLFMYLSFNAPHHPLDAPRDKLDKYPLDEIEEYWSGKEAKNGRKATTRQYYMAMVDAMDEAIGNVVDAVVKNGMKDNTLIVFCSDNGGIIEADNRPLRSLKGDSFEGGARVPGIVYWPGIVEGGSTSQELMHISDWYSTFSDVADIEYKSEHLDGSSALSILKGGKGQRDHIAIISEQRHALITPNFSLVGNSNNYQRSINNGLADFQLYDINTDVSQTKPTHSYEEKKGQMKIQLASYFPKVNRGFFNWDIKFAKYRSDMQKFDHSFDYVINDMPTVEVSNKGKKTSISISPVSDKLMYKLQCTSDGAEWQDIDEYTCRENSEKYTFPPIAIKKRIKEYRVLSDYHFGLPTTISFSTEEGYIPGPLYAESSDAKILESLPGTDGFLNVSAISGGKSVQVVKDGLKYKDILCKEGALNIRGTLHVEESYLTKYFEEPFNQGKVFVSMLLHYQSVESESVGQVNFLVQNGWGGMTEKQVSLAIQNDAIYCYQQDSPNKEKQESWMTDYHNEVVQVVFEYDLRTVGQDDLKIYINPDNKEKMQATATFKGELTFDRLQFNVTGRAGGSLTVDEVHLGRKLEDVL